MWKHLAATPDTPRAGTRPAWLILQALLTIGSLVVMAGSIALSIGPRFAPYEAYIVLSASMEPAIRLGSVVVVRPVDPETLQVGDIITYRRVEEPDITFTHRITQIITAGKTPVLRTKGDANAVEDPWDLQLRGPAWKYVLSVPYAGYAFVYAQTTTGRMLTLVLPAVVLGALWLYDIWTNQGRGGGFGRPSA